MNSVRIDIISDLVCPWCYISRLRLANALAQLPHLETRICWQPFELFPQIPAAGKKRHPHMARVFGSANRRDAVFTQVARAGQAEGINLRFDTIPCSPNTFAMHRLLWKAGQAGYQDELALLLFDAFFTKNRDLTQRSQLADLLEPFGWSMAQLEQFLGSDEGVAIVRHQQRLYQLAGITSVHTYLFNNQILLTGAQSNGQLRQALSQVARIVPIPEKFNDALLFI